MKTQAWRSDVRSGEGKERVRKPDRGPFKNLPESFSEREEALMHLLDKTTRCWLFLTVACCFISQPFMSSLKLLFPSPFECTVAPLSGKGVSKGREVAKAVRADLLHVEENIGWHQVAEIWRSKRKSWRKGLSTIEVDPRVGDSMVSVFSKTERLVWTVGLYFPHTSAAWLKGWAAFFVFCLFFYFCHTCMGS